MSTQAIELLPKGQITVTSDQLSLAQKTVAKGLNQDEFDLYLYNCQRQGIHPLDGLLIPIPRTDGEDRRLTFVSTVDLLRSRAAETNEYAGSDDAIFDYLDDPQRPILATVTVWRMVQGQRCAFTATARWLEYYPGDGKKGFMWREKPHVMLGKCAEGLALRKAFPKQLAGLYLEEELQHTLSNRPPAKTAPATVVKNVKCTECKAEGGHLPNCSKRKQAEAQPAAKPDNVVCASCGKLNSHDPACQYATKQGAAVKETTKAVVLILGVEHLLKTEDKNGKREPYVKLRVVNQANEEFDLFVWHKTPQQFLTPKVIDKNMLCEFSKGLRKDGTPYYSLETISEIAGQKFVDNKPILPKEEIF